MVSRRMLPLEYLEIQGAKAPGLRTLSPSAANCWRKLVAEKLLPTDLPKLPPVKLLPNILLLKPPPPGVLAALFGLPYVE